MSDIAKWALLAAAIIAIIALIVAFPFMQYIDAAKFSAAISTIINTAADGFRFARGLVNNFLSPWARGVFSGLLIWLLAKPILTYGIKVTVWVYHYIFK